ncbi:putative bifunctional diguanylate cyclase/phosphodiesterase [Psychromonas sp. KJ10-10]|uniref:putative bifunctional diguanylate cyclase/phosphodiesterase n=1 Tax=Psychromonas sp. KJ10-10 TaxID=3391823 RepID=UPI0039B59CF5
MSNYKEQQDKLIYQAQLDAVTQLPNRNQLLAHIEKVSSRAKYQNLYCAIVFIECNQYKSIHDFDGNYRGDPLLYDIARRIEKIKAEHDFIAHLSGSEFVAVLPDLHKQQDKATEVALEFTQKLDKSLKEVFVIEGKEIILSCAFGIELFPMADCNANDLLRQSQKAIIFSDENHFSNISFFTKEIEEKIQKRKQLQKQIHHGLDNDEFSLYFQPRVDIEGNLIGAEALIRWMHGSQGWVNPSEFIPVAEDSSLILPLGDWILKTAFKQLAEWQTIGLPDTFTRLSINVSPNQLLQVGFTDLIKEYLESTKVDANRIEIEITEEVLINYKALAINKINRLRELGFCFAIDDFGTGYSSFSYLSVLPVSTLKIDQSFIADLMQNENQQVIVTMIIKMAQSLKLEVVAEGVESQQQLTFLIEKGCTQFQGYLVGLPMAKQEFQTLLFKKT